MMANSDYGTMQERHGPSIDQHSSTESPPEKQKYPDYCRTITVKGELFCTTDMTFKDQEYTMVQIQIYIYNTGA